MKGGGTTRTSSSRNTRALSNSRVISNFENSFSKIKGEAFSRSNLQSLSTKELNQEYKNLVRVYNRLASIDPSTTIDDSTFTREDDHRLASTRREFNSFSRKIERTINRYEEELEKRYKV